jgi:hypothetical protein
MKIVFTIFIALFAVSALSQKWDKNEIDEFTGDTVRITKYERVTQTFWYNVTFSIIQYNSEVVLKAQYTGSTKSEIVCKDEDSKIIFKFETGDTHQLIPTGEIDCGNGTISIYYPLAYDDIKLLVSKSIEKYRIYYTDAYVDYDCRTPDYFMRTFAFMGLE